MNLLEDISQHKVLDDTSLLTTLYPISKDTFTFISFNMSSIGSKEKRGLKKYLMLVEISITRYYTGELVPKDKVIKRHYLGKASATDMTTAYDREYWLKKVLVHKHCVGECWIFGIQGI